jgi:hypothetical protein
MLPYILVKYFRLVGTMPVLQSYIYAVVVGFATEWPSSVVGTWLLEVVLLQDDVVDVEPSREAGLHVVLEDDVTEGLDGDQLFQPLLESI